MWLVHIRGSLELLWRVEEKKERIVEEIILAGEQLKEAVKLLMTIKGITPLTALAFLDSLVIHCSLKNYSKIALNN